MKKLHESSPENHSLTEKVDRFEDASLARQALLIATGNKPSKIERETIRRQKLGVQGRITEDALRIAMISHQDVAEYVVASDSERLDIQERLRGTEQEDTDPNLYLSIQFSIRKDHVLDLRDIIPGMLDEMDSYRYGFLYDTGETFIVPLRSGDPSNDNIDNMTDSLGSLPLIFIDHYEELGNVTATQLQRLEEIVATDLELLQQDIPQLTKS